MPQQPWVAPTWWERWTLPEAGAAHRHPDPRSGAPGAVQWAALSSLPPEAALG